MTGNGYASHVWKGVIRYLLPEGIYISFLHERSFFMAKKIKGSKWLIKFQLRGKIRDLL